MPVVRERAGAPRAGSPVTMLAAPDPEAHQVNPPLPRAHDDTRTVYAALALVWLTTRVIAVVSVDLTPWMLNDLVIYEGWLAPLGQGAFPAGDPTWQYPPGIATFFMATGAAAIDYRWAFTLGILLVDALVMAVLLLAHRRRPGSSLLGPWLWALAGVVVGSIMVVRFDVVPTLFAVLAILLVARPVRTGIAAALGFTVKVWPALMLFVVPRRHLPHALASFAVTVVLVLGAFALLTDGSLGFLANQQARGLQVESVGALPYLLFTLLGGDVEFGLKYGSIQVLMDGAETVGLVLTLVGLALFALIGWWRLSGRLESVPPGDVALAVMLVSVATSRVYSPQFNVWLVGITAVMLLDPRSRQRRVAAIVVVVSLLTQVVYPWSATQLVNADPLTVVIQGLRVAGLLVATVMALLAMRGRSDA
jgi:Glycosyltransferase family 87